jgi:uncharacterized membrane protein YidH (DUF202 family)
MIAFGFVLARAPAVFVALGARADGSTIFPVLGILLILLGAAAGVDGGLRYTRTHRRLSRGEAADHSPKTPLLAAAAVGAVAIALATWVAVAMF